LISAVCEGSPLLSIATSQASLVQDFVAYASADSALSSGGILAMLVIFMWFLSVGQELQGCFGFVSAILRLKRSSCTEFALADDESMVAVNTISHARLAFVLGVSAVRMIIGLALFLVGGLWLAAEVNIENLVLNAAALEFVMNFDEVLYYHFAPDIAQVVIQHATQLPGPSRRRWIGINGGPVIMFFLSILVVFVYLSFFVWPQILEIYQAQETLCGGDQGFVYVDLGFFPQTATTETDSDHLLQRTSKFQADFLHKYAFRDAISETTWLHASELRQAVEAGALSLYPRRCEDHQDLHRVELRLDLVDFVPFFQAFSGRSDAVSCEALADQCYATNSFWVRFLCPKTCGCDVYRGGLWVRTGCPQTCEENEYYWDQRDALACEDVSNTELQNDSIWTSWWVGNWTPWYHAQWAEGFEAQLVPGCDILSGNESGWLPELLCAYGDAAKFSGSLRLFCPETCGCKRSPNGCPGTCGL